MMVNASPLLLVLLSLALASAFTAGTKGIDLHCKRFAHLAVAGPRPHHRISPVRLSTDAANTDSSSVSNFEPVFVGIRRDFGNRLPQYKSDITDGLNAQTLATILFLFFACLAPAIGFGSSLSAATGGTVGVIEMVASTSISGVLYALLSAQPVQLIGPQGPVIAYVAAIYQLAQTLQVPFLALYAWTGLCASGFLALFAMISASSLVQHLTRWTDEIFSVLVSAIFLAQAVGDVGKTFSAAGAPCTALLTLFTCSLTFGTAVTLRSLNKTNYLKSGIRKNLANFAPAIGVIIGSLAARAASIHWGAAASLPAIQLPVKFVTSTGRSWLVSLAGLPVSVRWAAALPAGLAAAVLLYLDQNITARLVNHPRYRQTKGKRVSVLTGMHGDMLVLAGITAVSSLLGLPWMCGAPTRSAAHVRALSVVDPTSGEIQGTFENRVSGFSIHALIGLCAVAAAPRKLLAQVPQPALSGIFLYLGFTSLNGLDLWDRFRGLAKDTLDDRFRDIRRPTVTLFTVAQLLCVAAMMKVTKSKYGVVSPLLIAVLPLARLGLMKSGLVSKADMTSLDS